MIQTELIIILLKGLWTYVEARECHILSSGVLVTDKRMDLWYPLLNPSKTAGFLVAESQIVDIHLSFSQMLMESVAVVQVNQ